MATTVARLMFILVLTAGALVAGMITYPDLLTGQKCDRTPEAAFMVIPADREVKVLQQRTLLRMKVVKQLLAGELTLVEAASWFRILNGGHPVGNCLSTSTSPLASEGEKLCRQVLLWVKAELKSTGASSSEVARRLAALETELAHCSRSDGKILLP